jgi:hypothetical protein
MVSQKDMFVKHGQHAPLFSQKRGQLGKFLTTGQLQSLMIASKPMKSVVTPEIQQRRDKILQVIQKLNSADFQHVYDASRKIGQFDFFDVYALRSQFRSPKDINRVAERNISDRKYTLGQLEPYLVVERSMLAEFGNIAYLDWKQHRNLANSMSILMTLKKRGDQSHSIRNFLCKVLETRGISYNDIEPYLTVQNIGSKFQLVQVILCFVDSKNSRLLTIHEKLSFLQDKIRDPKMLEILRQYVTFKGTPALYTIDHSILTQ